MSRTIEIFVKHPMDPDFHMGYPYVHWYGTQKQLKKDSHFESMYYTTWTRKTGIPIKKGETKHVRITFEEITDEF
jgi:hypothetical protein